MSDHSREIGKNVTESVRSMIAIIAMVSCLGCNPEKPTDAKSPASLNPLASRPVLVELSEVKRGRIEEILERSSPLQAEAQVQVLARTQNPAIELFAEEGDKVGKGQILLRLEHDRQKTDYDQAITRLEKARVDFETQESLYNQHLISESQYRDAKFTFDQARIQSETAQRELEYTEVRAPIDGTVTSRTVKLGDQVNTGVPVFEIIDLDSTVAIIHVPEQFLPKLRTNMAARMISSTLNDQEFPGFVKRISPIVDAHAGTIKVVVGVEELGALRPGMWVDVELVLDAQEDALLIPKRSIVYDNDQTYAFKVYTDTNGVKRAKRQLVVPQHSDKVHIKPKGGFEVGDQIVVAGQAGLKDDSPIRELEKPDGGILAPVAAIVQTETNSPRSAKETTASDVN